MFHKKKNLNFVTVSNFLIFYISIIYSILIGSGYIGYGIDYLEIYHKENVASPSVLDFIGWTTSTLSINGINIGIYVTSFVISLSVGFICRLFFNIMKLNSLFFFIIIYLLILFSWPVINSTNNAMRQGLMMAFIFFSIIQLYNKKKFLAISFLSIALFTHKSAAGYIFVYIYSVLVNTFIYRLEIKKRNLLKFGLSLFFFSLIYITISDKWDHDRFENNVIIGENFVPIFFLINVIYIFYFTIRNNLLNNSINLYLYFFSFHSLSLIPGGLFWQFERYNMTLLLIFIFSFAACVKKNQRYLYLIIVFLLLLILTFLAGMYTEEIGIFRIY